VFRSGFGNDRILDFKHAEGDTINLFGVAGLSSFSQVLSSSSQIGGNIVITDNAGNTITIEGMLLNQLSMNMFSFNDLPLII
jgi:hypothetical protein